MANSRMSAYDAGTAYLQVVPSFVGVENGIKDRIERMAEDLAKSIQRELPKAFEDSVKKATDSITDNLNKMAEDVAKKVSDAVSDAGKKSAAGVAKNASESVKQVVEANKDGLKQIIAIEKAKTAAASNAADASLKNFTEAERKKTRVALTEAGRQEAIRRRGAVGASMSTGASRGRVAAASARPGTSNEGFFDRGQILSSAEARILKIHQAELAELAERAQKVADEAAAQAQARLDQAAAQTQAILDAERQSVLDHLEQEFKRELILRQSHQDDLLRMQEELHRQSEKARDHYNERDKQRALEMNEFHADLHAMRVRFPGDGPSGPSGGPDGGSGGGPSNPDQPEPPDFTRVINQRRHEAEKMSAEEAQIRIQEIKRQNAAEIAEMQELAKQRIELAEKRAFQERIIAEQAADNEMAAIKARGREGVEEYERADEEWIKKAEARATRRIVQLRKEQAQRRAEIAKAWEKEVADAAKRAGGADKISSGETQRLSNELDRRLKAVDQATEERIELAREETRTLFTFADRQYADGMEAARKSRAGTVAEIRAAADDRIAILKSEVEQASKLVEARTKAEVDAIRKHNPGVNAEERANFSSSTAGRAQSGVGDAVRKIQFIAEFDEGSVQAEIQDIRAKLKQISGLVIDVDLDAEAFRGKVEAEMLRLKKLTDDETVTINVRTDAARAMVSLARVQAMLNHIDGQKVEAKVDIDRSLADRIKFSMSRLQQLIAVGVTLGPAIIPIAAAAAASIGLIGTAALAGAVGIGVMALAFQGVGDAVSALNQAQDDAEKQNKSKISSDNQVANAIDGVRSAQTRLTRTIQDNRDAAEDAARRVKKAEKDLAQTRKDVARDAIEAAERVQEAQQNLARDERDVIRARERLNQAYEQATQKYLALGLAMKENSLDQQQSLLDIAAAKEELDALIANPRASQAEREQARLNYERRKLELDQLAQQQGELTEQYEDYTANGVEGSNEVKSAQDALADAQASVAASVKAVADAQREQTEAIVAGQEKILAAQQAVADARRAQDRQARDAAYALADAQQSVVQAQRSLAQAYAAAKVAGGEAYQAAQDALAKLSKPQQDFAYFIHGLRDDFAGLRAAAAEGLFPGLTTAIQTLLPYLPAFQEFVRNVGYKLGDLFVQWANAMKDPVFQQFFGYIGDTAVPMLQTLSDMALNIFKGFVGLFLGFSGTTDAVGGSLLDLTDRFAKWGEAVAKGEDQGFLDFLDYVKSSAKQVADFFGRLWSLAKHLAQALAPLGKLALGLVSGLAWLIESIPAGVLTAIAAGVAGVAAAFLVLNGILMVITTPPLVWIIVGVAAAVAALIAGIILLYQRWTPFRNLVDATWAAIKQVFINFWNTIKPIFDELGVILIGFWNSTVKPALGGIGDLFLMLWDMVKPVFELIGVAIDAIGQIIFWLWRVVVKPQITLLVWIFEKFLAPIIVWLYKNIVKPIFESITLAVEIAVALLKVAFGAIVIAVKLAGAIFGWLYENAVKPAWERIRPLIEAIGQMWAKHVQPHWDTAMKKIGEIWDGFVKLARTPIKFLVETILNDGLLAGYNWLAKTFAVKPDNVQIPAPKGGWNAAYHSGGVMDAVPGYNPGFDNHRFYSAGGGVLDLSGGEGIMRPELTALVRPWLEQGNKAARTGGIGGVRNFLGGYARGGVLPGGAGDGIGDWFSKKTKALWEDATDMLGDAWTSVKDLASDPVGALSKLKDKLLSGLPGKDTAFGKLIIGLPNKAATWLTDKVKDVLSVGSDNGGGSGTPGSAGGLGGSAGMMRILREQFPGLDLISGFRPGAITVTGNASYHGMNRAVDIPPRMDVFNWLHDAFPNSRELIFTPAGRRQIHNGQPHVYSADIARNHWDHVHWAYDQGGWLPDTRQMPGQTMQVYHGRRQPDAVLTNSQWSSISNVARQAVQAAGSGGVFQYEFKTQTLDEDRLRSIQWQRETLARTSRPNW